jgi:hypothetical protein
MPTLAQLALDLGLTDPAKADQFYEGWAAFRSIQSDAGNPYPDGSAEFEAWSDGYWAASNAVEAQAERNAARNYMRNRDD